MRKWCVWWIEVHEDVIIALDWGTVHDAVEQSIGE